MPSCELCYEALLRSCCCLASIARRRLSAAAAPPIDDARAAAAGIRKLPGKRLSLYTDLVRRRRSTACRRSSSRPFRSGASISASRKRDHADWHVTGCLMKDKARFVAAGPVPADSAAVSSTAIRATTLLWLYEQPSDYYRRELLLHEGTHGFMFTLLGQLRPAVVHGRIGRIPGHAPPGKTAG